MEPVFLWSSRCAAVESGELAGARDDLRDLGDPSVTGADLAVGLGPDLAARDAASVLVSAEVSVDALTVVGDAARAGLAVGASDKRDAVRLVRPGADLGDGLDLLRRERGNIVAR